MVSRVLRLVLSLLLAGTVTLAINNDSGGDEAVELSLKPFVSDLCSWSPESIPGIDGNWCECCVWHDLEYWVGGTRQDRMAADQAFKRCIEKASNKSVAVVMWSAVRVFGGPNSGAEFRWGFGLDKEVGYIERDGFRSERLLEKAETLAGEIPALCAWEG